MDELITGVHIEDIADKRFNNLMELIRLRISVASTEDMIEIKQMLKDASHLCMVDLVEMLVPETPKPEFEVIKGGKH